MFYYLSRLFITQVSEFRTRYISICIVAARRFRHYYSVREDDLLLFFQIFMPFVLDEMLLVLGTQGMQLYMHRRRLLFEELTC
jgi:hypothetical protein